MYTLKDRAKILRSAGMRVHFIALFDHEINSHLLGKVGGFLVMYDAIICIE